MTIEEMDQFVKKAKHGDRVVYHRGFLAEESGYNKEIRDFAGYVRSLESGEKISLVQKKIKSGGVGSNAPIYEYIAERIKNAK